MKFLGSREVRIVLLVLAAVASAIPAAATDFYTITPCRLYDSRPGPGGPLDQGVTYTEQITGECGVPTGASAVALNVTIIGANGSGDLAVFPAGSPPPFVGMLAFRAGRTQAVLQTVGLSPSGAVSFRATIPPPPPSGHFHFVIDVVGYFLAAKAVPDTATVTEDAAPTTINVLANDQNPNAETLTIGSATDPANGTVVIAGDNLTLTYEPDPDYCNDPPGTTLDTFTYTIAQSGSTATVSVKVTCVNDAPDAVDDAATVLEDAAATLINVLANDADAENDPFTIASASDPANGTVVIAGDNLTLTYQPDANYCGADSFTYTLSPGGDTATVSVTVTCVAGNPVAADDVATVAEDAAATPIDVLANDSDEESDPFFIASASDPAHGTVVLTGGTPGAHTGLTYQPDANYCGPDSFTYTLTPGGDIATVSVTVTCVNDNPNAVDDVATVPEDAAATAVNVLANDA
ncbi:MAG TPA: Ig-like domain-containing protein, partial [Acidimicrobiales bacterium]|nr:Ig-like domain-containing protein [Acidimicrobiales bacterium]